MKQQTDRIRYRKLFRVRKNFEYCTIDTVLHSTLHRSDKMFNLDSNPDLTITVYYYRLATVYPYTYNLQIQGQTQAKVYKNLNNLRETDKKLKNLKAMHFELVLFALNQRIYMRRSSIKHSISPLLYRKSCVSFLFVLRFYDGLYPKFLLLSQYHTHTRFYSRNLFLHKYNKFDIPSQFEPQLSQAQLRHPLASIMPIAYSPVNGNGSMVRSQLKHPRFCCLTLYFSEGANFLQKMCPVLVGVKFK